MKTPGDEKNPISFSFFFFEGVCKIQTLKYPEIKIIISSDGSIISQAGFVMCVLKLYAVWSKPQSERENTGKADSWHLDKLFISSANRTHNLSEFLREVLHATLNCLQLNKPLIFPVKNCTNAVGNR